MPPRLEAIGTLPVRFVEKTGSMSQISNLPAPTFAVLRPPWGKQPLALFSSLALHCSLFALLVLVRFDGGPEPKPVELQHQYTVVRILHLTPLPPQGPLRMKAPAASWTAAARSGARPGTIAAPVARAGQIPAHENGAARPAFVLPPVPRADLAEHTLIQPDVPPGTHAADVRVPDVLVWAPEKFPASPSIVPPRDSPQKRAGVRPVIDLAASDPNAGDVTIQPRPVVEIPRLPVPKSATSPVSAAVPEREKTVPETVVPTAEASTGHIISVSGIPLPPQALVAVPPVNRLAPLKDPEAASLAGVKAGTGKETGKGKGTGTDSATKVADTPAVTAARAAASAEPATSSADNGAAASPGKNPSATPNEGGDSVRGNGVATATRNTQNKDGESAPSRDAGPVRSSTSAATDAVPQKIAEGLTRLERSPAGRHNSVVLGTASASEVYPEAAGVLTGKIIYTVYLQVGLQKNWILQYCLPGDTERVRAAKGSVGSLDAPWPYVLVRPSGDKLRGDYTLVRGVINANGRFVQLVLVTPDEAAKKDLLQPLGQWEFRPANSDGRPTPVEILLIIPHVRE
jgi:hypothetical protein